MREQRYVSSSEVARLAGVSQSAVSRSFTPGASVSAATRERVMVAARTLGYRPNFLPQALMSSRSRLVAVAVGGVTNPFYAAVLEQLTRALQAAGQQVVLIQVASDYALDPVLDRIAGYRVDALVSALAVLSASAARALSGLRIPVVCFNGRIRGDWVSSVSLDNVAAGRAAAAHLVAAGGRRMAFVPGPADSPASQDRLAGFTAGLAERGLAPPLVVPGDYSHRSGLEAGGGLLSARVDAVACANDMMALGVMDAWRGRGAGPPPMLGFDNIEMAAWPSYALTSFDQDVPALVRRTLRLILDETALPDARAGVLEQVQGRLVVRRSTGGGNCPAPPASEPEKESAP